MTALYGYQQAGVRFLKIAGSALLADEMGVGKTVQTITTLEETEAFPALIVAPNSVTNVWLREFTKWAPDRKVLVAPNGTVAATKAVEKVLDGKADVLVVNWEALRNLSKLAGYGSTRLQACSNCDPNSTRKPATCEREPKILNKVPWHTIIADEAHNAKQPKAKQTRALWALGDEATRRYALTGTPVANSPADLWSIMRFVAPNEYPSKWTWLERYAMLSPNAYSGGMDVIGMREDRREELNSFFLPRFIRRTKAQVLPDLPPKTYERRDVYLTGKQKKAYDTMKDQMVSALDSGILTATDTLTNALRLRQLASAYGELVVDPREAVKELTFDNMDEEFDKVDAHVRLSEPSSKLDVLEEVLDELGDKQVVVFADSKQLIDMAFVRLTDKMTCAMVTGSISTAERAVAIDNFQKGNARVMLATVGAGGVGITLTAADTAIFLQRPWSQVLNSQAEDRLHRIGQNASNVLYIDLVAAGTIEEHVFEALQDKERKLEDVVQDKEALRKWLS